MGDEVPAFAAEVVDVVEGLEGADAAFAGEDDGDGGVGGTEEHVVGAADDVADVGVDDAAVAGDDDAPALIAGDDGLDGVDGALAEFEGGFGVGVDIPLAFAKHALADAEEEIAAEEFERGLFGRDVAEDFDLAQVVDDDGLEAVVACDGAASFEGALEGAGEDGIDAVGAEAGTDCIGLLAAPFAERGVDGIADGAAARVGDELFAVADEDEFGDAFDIGEEGAVEDHGRASGTVGHGVLRWWRVLPRDYPRKGMNAKSARGPKMCGMDGPHVSVMLRGWDVRTGTTGEMVLDAARRAEALGLDGVVAGDHVTFYGYGNDGLVTLTAVAAVTERVDLKTGVYLLPLRHPVPVALQAAQLDQLSLGRLILGVGVGGEDPHEFWSCGVDPRTRGARANEAIAILRRLWTEDGVSYAGRHFRLEEVTVYPKPLRPIPIFVGGRSDAALRRAGQLGDGYTGIWFSAERFGEACARIREVAAEAGRDPGGIEMGMQFWTSVADDREAARAQVAAGMEATYRLPFERFERYTPFGTAEEVATFIAGFVERGARHVNLITSQATPEEAIERAAEIREALHRLTR